MALEISSCFANSIDLFTTNKSNFIGSVAVKNSILWLGLVHV
ncbi:hypothetical protein CP01DC11_1483 [Chlamydia psittaci 01DC11]|nr:hypothetical protein CP01DC11_1483 [Chlamydia psittaci 01DC11]